MRSNSQKGVSLLEVMLVIAIAASIMVAGLRFYIQYQYQLNETKILANVNQLFQAVGNFYYANCRRSLNASGVQQSSGTLDPLQTDASGFKTVLAVSLTNDLLSGFIQSADWHPANPLLDNSPSPDTGYYIQFNRVSETSTDPKPDPTMSIFACSGNSIPPSCDLSPSQGLPLDPTKTTSPNPNPNPAIRSHVPTWVIQVAVKLSTTLTSDQWTQIKNDLNAQCVSSLESDQVTPCDAAPTADGYIVWQRAISFLRPDTSSDYWISLPYVREFNNQYTNDPMGGLTGVTNETQISSGTNWYNAQNYLCGG